MNTVKILEILEATIRTVEPEDVHDGAIKGNREKGIYVLSLPGGDRHFLQTGDAEEILMCCKWSLLELPW